MWHVTFQIYQIICPSASKKYQIFSLKKQMIIIEDWIYLQQFEQISVSLQNSWTNIFSPCSHLRLAHPLHAPPNPPVTLPFIDILRPQYLTLFIKEKQYWRWWCLEKVPRKSMGFLSNIPRLLVARREICTEKVPSRFHWISPAVFVFQITVWPGPRTLPAATRARSFVTGDTSLFKFIKSFVPPLLRNSI